MCRNKFLPAGYPYTYSRIHGFLFKTDTSFKFSTILQLIDHSHIVLIIGDLNGLGHLPEFADQIEPKTRLAMAEIVNKCRCVGTRVWKKFLKSRFLINRHVNKYAVNIPFIKLYLHYQFTTNNYSVNQYAVFSPWLRCRILHPGAVF